MSVPFVSSRIMATFAEKEMLLNQFDSRFPTEESCEAYFRSVRGGRRDLPKLSVKRAQMDSGQEVFRVPQMRASDSADRRDGNGI